MFEQNFEGKMRRFDDHEKMCIALALCALHMISKYAYFEPQFSRKEFYK